MKQYIITIILALCLASCSQHSKHWETLAQIESYIEESPDSALNVLQGMDKGEFSGMEEKAKYALLMSIALDKNWVDVTDETLINEAVDYYSNSDDIESLFKAYFYQGRIYVNAHDYPQAVLSYIKAEELLGSVNDNYTAGMLYRELGNIYLHQYDYEKSIKAYEKAYSYYSLAELELHKAHVIMHLGLAYWNNEDFEKAEEYITKALNSAKELGDENLECTCYQNLIAMYDQINDHDKCRENIDVLTSKFNLDAISPMCLAAIASHYASNGELKKINPYLDAAKQRRLSVEDNVDLYFSLANIMAAIDNDSEALSYFNEGCKLQKNVLKDVLRQPLETVLKEYYQSQAVYNALNLKFTTQRHITIGIIALIVAIYIATIICHRLKQSRAKNRALEVEKQMYEQLYADAIAERDALNDMISNSIVKDETMEIIKKRLGVLNTIIVSHLSEKGTDVKRANEELEKLIADRNDFIKSTRLTLEENYPRFFAYLHDKGLEEFEIDFCCLYAIGLKGKEIKTYTNLSRHYKDSSEVRQKLGLVESDTNLSNFLQKLLNNQQG